MVKNEKSAAPFLNSGWEAAQESEKTAATGNSIFGDPEADLDRMSADELRAYAAASGISLHYRVTDEAKIRNAIKSALAEK